MTEARYWCENCRDTYLKSQVNIDEFGRSRCYSCGRELWVFYDLDVEDYETH